MRLAVVGGDGRMGREVIRAASLSNVELSAVVVHEGSSFIGKDAGEVASLPKLNIAVTSDASTAFTRSDAVIDFTTPDACVSYALHAQRANIAFVTGTTGLSHEQQRQIIEISASIPVVQSGNMSLGVNLLAVLVRQAAAALSARDFDIEITEMHHRHKVDAPSGTALLLGQSAARARGEQMKDVAVFDRSRSTGCRKAGTIGFSSLRGGSVVGDHSVIFAGDGERIMLSHFAENRSIFANGAIKAAQWLMGKRPGLYSMEDVLGLTDRRSNDR